MPAELPIAATKFLARQPVAVQQRLLPILADLHQAAAEGAEAIQNYLLQLDLPEPTDWALLIEAAARLGEPQLVTALAANRGPETDKTLRKAWKRVRYYLETQGMTVPVLEEGPPASASRPGPPAQLQAYLSAYDRQGVRMLIIEKLAGNFRDNTLLQIFKEDEGIIDGYSLWLSKKKQRQHLEELAGMPPGQLIKVPLPYAIGLLEEAYQAEPTGDNEGIRAYRQWRDWLLSQVGCQVQKVTDLLAPLLPGEEAGDFQAENRLLDQPELAPFLPQPEQLAPWLAQIKEVEDSPLVLPNHLQGQRYRDLVTQACQEIFPPEHRPRLSRRLQELAYYFYQTGRPVAARQAQVVAQELAEPPSAFKEEPLFLRFLVLGSLTASHELQDEAEEQAAKSQLILTKW